MRLISRPFCSRGAVSASPSREARARPSTEMLDGRRYCFGGMKVGPMVRIGFFSHRPRRSKSIRRQPVRRGGGAAGAAPFLAVDGGGVWPFGCALAVAAVAPSAFELRRDIA
jgi:hypothetical protein